MNRPNARQTERAGDDYITIEIRMQGDGAAVLTAASFHFWSALEDTLNAVASVCYVYGISVPQPGKKVLATILAAWARVTSASGRK